MFIPIHSRFWVVAGCVELGTLLKNSGLFGGFQLSFAGIDTVIKLPNEMLNNGEGIGVNAAQLLDLNTS